MRPASGVPCKMPSTLWNLVGKMQMADTLYTGLKLNCALCGESCCVENRFKVKKQFMHIQKLLAIICVGAVFSSYVVQGVDTDAQAKARAQLRQAMADMNTTNSPVSPAPMMTPAPAAMPSPEPAPVVVPKPAKNHKPVFSDPPPASPGLSQTYSDPQTAPVSPAVVMPTPAMAAPAPVDMPSPAIAPAALNPMAMPTPPAASTDPLVTFPTPAYIPPNPDAQAKALEAMRAEKARLDAADQTLAIATGHATPPTAHAGLRPIMDNSNTFISAQTGMPVQVAPPSYAPGSKDQRLSDLLALYKSDQISPTEYHAQRAKILAEP